MIVPSTKDTIGCATEVKQPDVSRRIETSLKGNLDYSCEDCGCELWGDFGDNVSCGNCQKVFETDWDYFGDSIGCWITKEL